MSYINRKIKKLVSKFNIKKLSKDNYKENEIQVESELDSSSVNINHKNCYYYNYKPWCKECVPRCIIEGWTSENHNIDEFIKDTIYNAKISFNNDDDYYPLFLEWVPFDRFEDIKQIGEGGFAKVYSATWVDGQAKYKRKYDGIWKKKESSPMKIALKRLNDSQNISVEYLNELQIHCDYCRERTDLLKFYGMTKDPVTKEFMMIVEFSEMGNLRSVLSKDFNNILWKDKINFLYKLSYDLDKLHKLGYCHKDFHSGNILQIYYGGIIKSNMSYISDFGLSGPLNKQTSDGKLCGVLPYVAPEVLNGEPYTLSSDIYSFGVIMTELSSGKPPFHKRKHDTILALEICNGLRPEFGKGTPEIYKKLAYRCMNANPDQRPTADELKNNLMFWYNSHIYDRDGYREIEEFGYKVKEIKAMFEEADKEIPNISTTYEKNPDAVYTSRLFTFSNLPKPINSPIITSYLNEEENKGTMFTSYIIK
ncbi:kinase-like domain-containing protein [Rhizophagus irregularis DAOM 181602=DAOM 197198]|uniref:Kinase-like domain-containing protein n=1 Tax=Rhizophagus irregularis (strain DAOM 181602 / DAOM 197198 / MUCL 43194) TaxID=747089 RepID=A0A2P4QNB9_RHIID|nr:kinase-like domain-containing protein [Rhizophagus irregularis DAOM 181602=DAOM 197198]POG79132.1 kinase-like domain-containing protein [Rhizophagus irregularis DAOM 181602=DAOM 197198]|eukprot:XP_025185998.1 kinase-like domain-containing protein [Rhizophagus irregularis DAOM 181602=DAOM 197198]